MWYQILLDVLLPPSGWNKTMILYYDIPANLRVRQMNSARHISLVAIKVYFIHRPFSLQCAYCYSVCLFFQVRPLSLFWKTLLILDMQATSLHALSCWHAIWKVPWKQRSVCSTSVGSCGLSGQTGFHPLTVVCARVCVSTTIRMDQDMTNAPSSGHIWEVLRWWTAFIWHYAI